MCVKMRKIAMVSDDYHDTGQIDDYHDIGQILLLNITGDSKNWTISIIAKENIMVNRQNWLIAHPYSRASIVLLYPHDKS